MPADANRLTTWISRWRQLRFRAAETAALSLSSHSRSYGHLEKCRPRLFSPRKADNAIFASPHFQSLVVIENGGTSVCRTGTLMALQSGWSTALIGAVVAAMFLCARQYLMPPINSARDAETNGERSAGRRFQRLHLASVIINGARFFMLLGVAVILTRA